MIIVGIFVFCTVLHQITALPVGKPQTGFPLIQLALQVQQQGIGNFVDTNDRTEKPEQANYNRPKRNANEPKNVEDYLHFMELVDVLSRTRADWVKDEDNNILVMMNVEKESSNRRSRTKQGFNLGLFPVVAPAVDPALDYADKTKWIQEEQLIPVPIMQQRFAHI